MKLSIHIPKTAGTTFRELLQKYYGEAICLHYYRPFDYTGRPIDEIPSGTQCVHGHFGARRFLENYNEIELITWIRNPVDRVVSEYEHLKRSPDPQSGLSQLIAAGATLLDFAEHDYARNTHARYFDGINPDHFTFVGLSENFDSELDRFHEITGIDLPKGHRVNVNPFKRGLHYSVTDIEREKLMQLNTEDFDLYDYCTRTVIALPRAS